jgi:MSHA type pilus biogenesis protein MshL
MMDNPTALAQMAEIVNKIDQPVANRIFNLKYAKAEDMKTKVAEMLTKDVGSLEVDTRTNKVSVTDIESRLNDIERVVNAFDEKPRQVLIEAKIVQVTLTDQYRLGVDWQGVFTKMEKDYNFRSKFSLANAGTFPTGFTSGGEVLIGTFGMQDYAMLIQALKTVGDTNLLSSPRITALNNQEAKILVGTSQPYATNTVVTPAAGATTTASTLSFLDIGIKLFVTPSISQDGFITMKIKPEVSSSTSNYTYGDPPTTVPIVSTTQAETSVRIKDGSTIIIAGLIKDERGSDVSKVPFAGDIPIFGNMFKKTDKTVAKQELVIFITPHIVSGENDYLKVPPSPPVGKKDFTLSETQVFERRKATLMDPTYLKKEGLDSSDPSQLYDNFSTPAVTQISAPISAEDYYYSVKDKIMEHIDLENPALVLPLKGSIQISFRLSSAGALASEPFVRSTTHTELAQPALDAVRAAAPFFPFPEAIPQPEKEFTMDFVFE